MSAADGCLKPSLLNFSSHREEKCKRASSPAPPVSHQATAPDEGLTEPHHNFSSHREEKCKRASSPAPPIRTEPRSRLRLASNYAILNP